MRRISAVILAIMIASLFAVNGAQAVGIGLRLNGGLSYIGYKDFNDFADGVNARLMLEPAITGTLDNLHWLSGFGGEVFMSPLPAIDVGLGAGMMVGKSSYDFAIGDEGVSFEHEVKSYPVTATVYAKIPVPFGFLKPFVFAGGGLYPTTVTFAERMTAGSESAWYDADLSKTGFGVHGGAGFSIPLIPTMSIDFSFRGRIAKIKGFTGTSKDSDGGSADVFLAKDVNDEGFTNFGPRDVADKSDYEEASVDLSGYAFMLGLTFSF